MPTRHSQHVRASGDFYTEPAWAVAALFRHLAFGDGLHDPCCGAGTIVDTAMAHGIAATGADIADRACGRFAVRDFLADDAVYPNICTNPPYRLGLPVISHALIRVEPGGCVVVLVPIGFLVSMRRRPLFVRPECELVVVRSRRPSLPPGELLQQHGECIRRSGSTDFVWIAFRRGRSEGVKRIEWALP